MYFDYGATHEKFAWEARTELGVIDVFSKLWETNELLAAFDGFNVTLPRRKDMKWTPWPHCDQSPNRKGKDLYSTPISVLTLNTDIAMNYRMQAVHGLLNFAPNGPKDGGLVLMKGASNLFDEFFAQKSQSFPHEDAPPPELNWEDVFFFDEKDIQWFKDRGCELVKINMDPGDFVLWDSRTIHYATFLEGHQIRHAQYICMTPKRFATPEALELRGEIFKKYLGTTHWPHRYVDWIYISTLG